MTEIFLHVEDRTIIVDIEPNSVQGLKDEFDALCEEDEALKERRRQFAPTYSMFHSGLKANVEIKRKYVFCKGDKVYVAWAPLKIGQPLHESVNDEKENAPINKQISKPDELYQSSSNDYTECAKPSPKALQLTSSNSQQNLSSVTFEPIQFISNSVRPLKAAITESKQSDKNKREQETDKGMSLRSKKTCKLPPEAQPSTAGHLDSPETNLSDNMMEDTEESLGPHASFSNVESQPGSSKQVLSWKKNESSDNSNHYLEWKENESGNSDDSKDDDWYGKVMEYFTESEWKNMSKALKRRERNRFELHEEQLSLGLTKTPFQPDKTTSPKPSTRNVCTPLKKKRSSSFKPPVAKRSSKGIQSRTADAEADNSDSTDDPNSEAGPSAASETTSKKKRRPNTKPKCLPGQELVGSRLMPNFSEVSVKSIQAGKPNMTFILADIRNHIVAKRGSLYLSKSERENMSKAIVKKYNQLADVDGDGNGFSRLALSISASIRGKRNYEANTKPRRQAAKLQLKSNSNKDFTVDCQEYSEEETMNAELRAGTSDQARVKFLIGRTLEIREVEFETAYKASDPETRSKKCQEIWESYPHFKDGKLIIYEHCLHLKLKQEVMQDNFKIMVGKLSTLFNMSSESGPDILRILENLYEEITPRVLRSVDKKIMPPIEIRDEGEAEGRLHIKTYHPGHAPCVLATTLINEMGDEVLSRSYLKMYNTCLGTIEDPTPCDVALQLLAPYFIGNIQYPDAYKSYLRFIEKYVHGTLCCQTSRQNPHSTYTSFVRRYESIK